MGTLATTAPAGSKMVPVIVPRSLWAKMAEQTGSSNVPALRKTRRTELRGVLCALRKSIDSPLEQKMEGIVLESHTSVNRPVTCQEYLLACAEAAGYLRVF